MYANRKENKPVVITPGHIAGIITNRKASNWVQPSTFALSSNSLGIFWKKECNIHNVNGWLIATKTTIVVGKIPIYSTQKMAAYNPLPR